MFALANYEKEIKEGASRANISNEVALNKFVLNLVVMRPHYDIFPDTVNFRTLGQEWNKLPSDVRIAQRDTVLALINRASRTRNSHE